MIEEELSEADILHFKEQNHRRVKRVVTLVAITLMLTALMLVVLSLSLGSKIDDLGKSATGAGLHVCIFSRLTHLDDATRNFRKSIFLPTLQIGLG